MTSLTWLRIAPCFSLHSQHLTTSYFTYSTQAAFYYYYWCTSNSIITRLQSECMSQTPGSVLRENNLISDISIAVFQIRKLILRINNLIKISELIKSRGSTQLRVYWKPNPCFEPLCKNQYSSLRAWLSLPLDYQPSEGKDPVEFIFIDILCLIKYLLETQESV